MTGNPEAHANASWNGHGHMPAGPHHGVDPEFTSDAAVPRQSPSAASGFPSDTTPTAEWETKEIERRARWYLASARNAVRVIAPNFPTIPDPDGSPPADPPTFDTAQTALAWFEQERDNLITTVRAAFDGERFDLA